MLRIDEADAVGVLGALLGEVVVGSGPTRMAGGRSADLFGFRLSAGPPELVGRALVLRVLPRACGSLRECAIQRELSDLDYPTPAVVASGVVDAIGPAMVMAHVGGVTLFESLGPLGALRRAPARLAALMLRLHRVDPTPVRRALARSGPVEGVVVEQRALSDIDRCLEAIAHPGHARVRGWLDAHRPAPDREVVCHGDLHALNVLVDGDDENVIDWELSGIGDPAFDVGRTKLIINAVPMEISRVGRPIIQRLGRRAAAEFERCYVAGSPIAPATLAWYEVLHTARVIAIVLAHRSESPSDPVVDGWRPTLPLLTASLHRLTGVSLTR